MKSIILLNTSIEKKLEIIWHESQVLTGAPWESSAGKRKKKVEACL